MENLFAERLSEFLQETRLSKREFARRLGMSAMSVSDWTTGKVQPTAESIFLICETFDLSSDYLLGRTDDFGAPIGTPAFVPQQNNASLGEDEKLLISYYKRLAPKNKNMLFNLMKNIFDEAHDIPLDKITDILGIYN